MKLYPTRVILPNKKVIQASCSGDHTAVVTDDGELYTFGYNGSGELGLKDYKTRYCPTKVTFNKKIIRASCGDEVTAIITEDGELYTCGRNDYGELGIVNNKDINVFTKVPFDKKVTYMSFGEVGYLAVIAK